MKEILVDNEGYNQFYEELEKLKELSISNSTLGSEVYRDAIGDGWHDNFAFEQTMRDSRLIAKRIDDMLEKKKYLKVVKTVKKNKKMVDIGDVVEVEIKYSDTDVERETIKLTGKYIPNTDNDINEISLNSPLGMSLYKSKVGSTVNYLVGENEFTVSILSKIDN
jgi:transcription elongation GreA/GreB family factor